MAITIRLILAYWLISACVDMLPGQYANCFRKPFVEPRKGKRLPVSIIANVTAETIHFCASICLKRSSCQSFNYRRNASTYQCQLNEFDHENNVRDDPNYVYSSIYDWNPLMVYSCANHSCSEDSFCLPTLSQTYTCLHLDIQCGSPKSIEGTVDIQWPYPRQYKSKIKYQCKPGYKYLNGDSTSVCQLNMTWSEPSINCTKIICGIPPNISNTDLKNYTGNDYGSTAYYECTAGYNGSELIGESRCIANGTWTEPNINCTEISCGPPPSSSTAKVSSLTGTSIGDIAVYSCLRDSILKSDRNFSVCTSAAVWSKHVECGTCGNYKNITYQGRQVCYVKSQYKHTYFLITHHMLIASERPIIDIFKRQAKYLRINVFAGFEVNRTHISFHNGTSVVIPSTTVFDLGDCKNTICIYNGNGQLTNIPARQMEAYSYSFYLPK